MTQIEMDVRAYLSRINYSGPVEPSLEVMRSLHTCHLLSVPFENLAAHSGGRMTLDPAILYDKIVNQRRGGLCYENNGLFSWLLNQVGFKVTVLSAQVKSRLSGFFGPPFDHFVNMVTLDGHHWLCDVGFGVPGFWTPLSLDTSGLQEQGHRVYRIREASGMRFMEWQQEENRGMTGDWTEIYKFTLEPRHVEDFAEMCEYHQSSPYSLFFCKTVCTVLKPDGRVTYLGRELTEVKFPKEGTGNEVKSTTREIKDDEVVEMLAENFGIVLKSPLVQKDEPVAPPPVEY